MEYEIAAADVLAVLAEKAKSEPLLAAWIEAAQWQSVAIRQAATAESDAVTEPDPGESI